jgi:formylmethanofuran dehydrogenase subunit A
VTTLRIAGGTVYDPANGVDGVMRDICVQDGKIVSQLPADAPRIDARGMVVMAGAIDIHSHVAASSVNAARRLIPDEHDADPVPAPQLALDEHGETTIPRSGTGGTVPTTFTTGYRYAAMGYTTVFDAAVAPVTARDTHGQLDDTPIVDAGCFILMGNDAYLLRQIASGAPDRVRDYIAWLLGATRGYAVKIVNPGGIELWKENVREVKTLDDPVGGNARVTPRAILETLTTAANALALPHPVHIHCNNLGVAGNVATTLESMRTVAGQRAHFTHVQFHSYAGERGKGWASGAKQIVAHLAAHPETTCDVGQVMFGPACTITADGALEYMLHTSAGGRWINVDIELETGCGVVPFHYRDTAAVAALQWVVGLELFLLSPDPWRVVLSTDHPNGATFQSYPELIHLLMDRAYRDEKLKTVNQKFLAGSALADGLAREYTFGEIAIITRAGPARILGLTNKGHLGAGADADVTVYTPDANRAQMFGTPRYVVKAGTLVVEEGQLRRAPLGQRHSLHPEYDAMIERDLKAYFDRYGTVAFENYPVQGPPAP